MESKMRLYGEILKDINNATSKEHVDELWEEMGLQEKQPIPDYMRLADEIRLETIKRLDDETIN